jgi:hypothetical protein
MFTHLHFAYFDRISTISCALVVPRFLDISSVYGSAPHFQATVMVLHTQNDIINRDYHKLDLLPLNSNILR